MMRGAAGREETPLAGGLVEVDAEPNRQFFPLPSISRRICGLQGASSFAVPDLLGESPSPTPVTLGTQWRHHDHHGVSPTTRHPATSWSSYHILTRPPIACWPSRQAPTTSTSSSPLTAPQRSHFPNPFTIRRLSFPNHSISSPATVQMAPTIRYGVGHDAHPP